MQRYLLALITLLMTSIGSLAQNPKAAPSILIHKLANSPDHYKGRQIVVGSGGGFTGETTAYYLLDNGTLFAKRSSDSNYTTIGKQSSAATKRIFTSLENTCKIKSTKFDHPGNQYYFVNWQKGRQQYRVTWGDRNHTVPARYKNFYNTFLAMIPPSSRL